MHFKISTSYLNLEFQRFSTDVDHSPIEPVIAREERMIVELEFEKEFFSCSIWFEEFKTWHFQYRLLEARLTSAPIGYGKEVVFANKILSPRYEVQRSLYNFRDKMRHLLRSVLPRGLFWPLEKFCLLFLLTGNLSNPIDEFWGIYWNKINSIYSKYHKLNIQIAFQIVLFTIKINDSSFEENPLNSHLAVNRGY